MYTRQAAFLQLVASLALCAGFIGALVWWSGQTVQQPALVIEAAADVPENGLSIYAQFVVTQTLTLPDPALVTKLVVPLYFSADTGDHILIELWRGEKLVSRWRYRPQAAGSVELATLPIVPPQLVDGALAVRFSARDLEHAQKDGAPRLFIETADQYYGGGNYFIADNAKAGDVALSLYAEQTNEEMLWQRWQHDPIGTSSFLLSWLAAGLLIGALPYVMWRR